MKTIISGEIKGCEIIVGTPYTAKIPVVAQVHRSDQVILAPESLKSCEILDSLYGPDAHSLTVDIQCCGNLIIIKNAVPVLIVT